MTRMQVTNLRSTAVRPDLRADWEGVPYFVEIRTVGFSEDEDRRDSVTNEIFGVLNATPSRYQVMLTVGDDYHAGSEKLRHAITAVLTSLNTLKDRGEREATLHNNVERHGAELVARAFL